MQDACVVARQWRAVNGGRPDFRYTNVIDTYQYRMIFPGDKRVTLVPLSQRNDDRKEILAHLDESMR